MGEAEKKMKIDGLKEYKGKIVFHFVLMLSLAAIAVMGIFVLTHFYTVEIPYNFVRTTVAFAGFLFILLNASFLYFCFGEKKEDTGSAAFAKIWCFYGENKEKKKQEDKIPRTKKALLALPGVFGIGYMLFFFGISETFFANVQEWLFSYRDIVIPATFFTVAFTLVFLGIYIFLLKGKYYNRGIIVLASVFAGLYLQNAFLNTDKFINGAKDEVSHFALALNLIVWILLIVLPQVFYGKMEKSRKYIRNGAVIVSAILFLIQLIPLPYLFVSFEKKKPEGYGEKIKTEYRLAGDEQFTVSAEGNIIVFIMDGYQDTNFEYHLKNYPEKAEIFKDFIHFDNVATEEMNTVTSMPSLLTASRVDYTIDLVESNKKAWNGDNANAFYSEIQKAGYSAFLYSDSDDYCGDADNMVGKIKNAIETKYEIKTDPVRTFFAMTRLSLYKYLPFTFKDFVNVSGSEEINRYTSLLFEGDEKVDAGELSDTLYTAMDRGICMFNFDYYAALKKGLKVEQDGKRIVFEHMFGMHQPYYSIQGKEEVSNAEEQDVCFTILEEYMSQLKELGLYDKTCIIVTADHGFPKIGESDPVMLIKLPDYHGEEMKTNTAPGCLQSDLLPTVLEIAGCNDKRINGGSSLLQLQENSVRERTLNYITTKSSFPPAKKCNGVGFANSNCYEEYRFTGRSEEIDKEKDLVAEKPITSYWW